MKIIFDSRKFFSAKFVPKSVVRESFCQKFRVFFSSRKFLPAKVSALKVNRKMYEINVTRSVKFQGELTFGNVFQNFYKNKILANVMILGGKKSLLAFYSAFNFLRFVNNRSSCDVTAALLHIHS